MDLKIIDTRGIVHFEGEDYLSQDSRKGKVFMVHDTNHPRVVLKDEIENGKRTILLNSSVNIGE